MAHKKGGGSAKNGRDSRAQRLGVKRYGGQVGALGQHHCPAAWHAHQAGQNVGVGRDYTLFATIDGVIKFEPLPGGRRRVSVYPAEA